MAKQVIVVRKDLNMRKGKIAAQVAHASLGAILKIMDSKYDENGNCERKLKINKNSALDNWINGVFTKICVYVNSEEELLALYDKVKDTDIIHCLVRDNGLTEFHNVPTYTCLAIGADDNDKIDEITGGLPLL